MPEEAMLGEGAWVAMYMPDTSGEDPTAALPSEAAAWEYVFARMCKDCKREREIALGATPTAEETAVFAEIEASEYPACAYEWEVITRAEYDSLAPEAPAAPA